jgi:coenzyme Q-binding protein COQ10
VADIPSYSSFIPFCATSAVLLPGSASAPQTRSVDTAWEPPGSGHEPFEVDAELKVGFGGFDEAYVSRVKGTPFESVSATAREAALFKSLSTTCTLNT